MDQVVRHHAPCPFSGAFGVAGQINQCRDLFVRSRFAGAKRFHRFEVIYRFRFRVGSLMELNEWNPSGFQESVHNSGVLGEGEAALEL